MQKFTVVVTLLLGFHVSTLRAQEVARVEKPKTKLEAFQAQDGQVIVKGFSTVGTVKALYSGIVSVDAKEFLQPANGQKAYGITIEVKEQGRIERNHTSFIDLDEIESVVKGLDYIAKIDKSAVKLDDFQADYRTRGDFTMSTFSSEGKTMLSVKSGTIGGTSAYFNQDDISKVRALFEMAKAKLDAIRK